MTKCIIHIGMHKTGTSSIQQSLERFEDDRFVYPDLADSFNHTETLVPLFSANPQRVVASRLSFGKRRIGTSSGKRRARFATMAEALNGRTLILSSEGLYTKLNEAAVSNMKEFLDRWFNDYAVVAYIRPPASFMSSSFQNMVKSNGRTDFALRHKRYRRHFEKFDAVFGREQVSLVKFDANQFPGRDVVRDFCQRLGIPLPAERIKRSNESLSREQVGLLYVWNRFVDQTGAAEVDRAVARALRQAAGQACATPFRLSPILTSAALDEAEAQADIAWMEERMGQSLREDPDDLRPTDVTGEADLLRADPAVTEALHALARPRAAGRDAAMQARLQAFLTWRIDQAVDHATTAAERG